MSHVKITELRPGVCIRQISTRRTGVIVAPPRGESVELGRSWVDLGTGPEQIKDEDIDIGLRHIRLTVRHNPQDPADDLKQVARLRRDLWAHSPVEVDADKPSCQTHRDDARNATFEFATEFPDEVRRVLREYGHEGRATMEDRGEVGLVCARCGFLTGYVTVCPNCQLRDIEPCPHCGHEVARERYEPATSELFVCPDCRGRVRFEFNPDVYDADGALNEPVVLVQDAQV
jgi:hypothetical protein